MIVYGGRNGLAAVALWMALGIALEARAAEAAKDGRVRLHVVASDPYGGKLAFKWAQLEGPEGKILDSAAAAFDDKGRKWVSETYFVPSKPGMYTFQVTVTSEEGLTTKKTFVMEAKRSGSE